MSLGLSQNVNLISIIKQGISLSVCHFLSKSNAGIVFSLLQAASRPLPTEKGKKLKT